MYRLSFHFWPVRFFVMVVSRLENFNVGLTEQKRQLNLKLLMKFLKLNISGNVYRFYRRNSMKISSQNIVFHKNICQKRRAVCSDFMREVHIFSEIWSPVGATIDDINIESHRVITNKMFWSNWNIRICCDIQSLK